MLDQQSCSLFFLFTQALVEPSWVVRQFQQHLSLASNALINGLHIVHVLRCDAIARTGQWRNES